MEAPSLEPLVNTSGERHREAEIGTSDNLVSGRARDPLEPPTWRSHINTGKDILDDVRV